ncbi:MAG TPA: Asp-tRNA(Asn)/Glu-tRNA(Gln) amidotransferase subunit GatB [Micropepsaceae bacterium]|nr:Asp-tRNA(Asn)/Glu-tRNA(Gln) amidotransferase subunit GatB [Micropepsaceae bacterium]
MSQTQSKLIEGSTGPWEIVIGMEVHAQIASKAKLFSGAPTEFGAAPNAQVSFVDAAFPGMLPVINRFCVEQAVRTGLGLKAKINLSSVFDRKNYFYPDLPAGYQISQYKDPVVGEGHVDLDMPDGEVVHVGIERLHLEQDAGKSLHDQNPDYTYVDLNRAGVALMEIVSRPDMRSSAEASAFLGKLRAIVRYLGTCDGNMDQGSMRADVNVSVRRPGDKLGTRCEIKNVNSMRFVKKAVEHEAQRQIDVIEGGGTVRQETRLFDSKTGETRSMRSKEDSPDYRYFPDPDLLPLVLDQSFVDEIARGLPELPDQKKARYVSMGLSPYKASVLVAEREASEGFESAVQGGVPLEVAANWYMNDVPGHLSKAGLTISTSPVSHQANTDILKLVTSGQLSFTGGRMILEIKIQGDPATPEEIMVTRGLKQMTDDSAIEAAVESVLAANPARLEEVKSKPKAAAWFVGQVMKMTSGKANPQKVNAILKRRLGLPEEG